MGYASTFATPTQTQTQVLATSRCTRIGQNESKIRHRPQWAFFFALAATIPLRANADGNMFTTSLFQNVWFWGPFLRNAKRHFNKKPRDEWSGSKSKVTTWKVGWHVNPILFTSELQMLGCVDERNIALSTWGIYSCLLQTCAVLLPICWIPNWFCLYGCSPPNKNITKTFNDCGVIFLGLWFSA